MRLRTADIASRVIGDSVMILDLATNQYHLVGGSGVLLLECLQEEVEPTDLVDALVARYGVDRERAAGDVTAFLANLDANGLLDRPSDAVGDAAEDR